MTIENMIEEAVTRGVSKALASFQPPTEPQGPPVLSVKEAAQIAKVSAATVYDWTHIQGIDWCIPVGRNKKILRHRFMTWLERQAEGVKD